MIKINPKNIINLHNSGLSAVDIAKELRCSTSTVYNTLNNNKIQYKKTKQLTDKNKNEVKELYSKGLSVKEVAKLLDLEIHNVYFLLKKLDIKLPTNVEILSARKGNKSPLWRGFECIPGSFLSYIENSAKARSIYFDLDIKDIYKLYVDQDKKCRLSDIDLFFGSRKISNSKRNVSLDRIDSNLGYIKHNIQLVDSKINIMKKDFTTDHFYYMCDLVNNPVGKDTTYEFERIINVSLIFRISERRAKDKNFEFDLTRSDLINLYEKQNKRCSITNLPIEFKAEYKKPFFNQVSIDRIDSNLGYLKSNIQLVIKDINFMKHKLDLVEFKSLCKKIINHKESKNYANTQ